MSETSTRPNWANLLEVEAILAVGSLIVFSAALWSVIAQVVPAANEKYVMLMLGALIGVVKDTFGRYFQATKGAQDARKDAAVLAQTVAEGAAAAITPADQSSSMPPKP